MTINDATETVSDAAGNQVDTDAPADLPEPPKEVIAAGIAVWPAGPSMAWALVTNDTRKYTGLVRGQDAKAGYLQAFEQVVALTEEPDVARVELFCSDKVFLEAVAAVAAAWPTLTIHPWSEIWERCWLVSSARTLARRTIEPAPAPAQSRDRNAPLLAATDGSKGARGVSGFGWVTAEGEFGYGRFSGSILLTELAAVEALLRATPKRRPLTVLMDSLDALAVLDGLQRGEAVTAQRVPGTHASWALLRRIEHRMRGRELTFEWVRGHSGNPLNECADRIALQARRHLNGGTAAEVIDTVMARIIADFRATGASCSTTPQLAHVA